MIVSSVGKSYLPNKNLYAANSSSPIQFRGDEKSSDKNGMSQNTKIFIGLFLAAYVATIATLSYRKADNILKGTKMNFLPKLKLGYTDLINSLSGNRIKFELTKKNTLRKRIFTHKGKLYKLQEYNLPEGKEIKKIVFDTKEKTFEESKNPIIRLLDTL